MRYPRLIWENENGLTAEFSVYSEEYFCNVQRDVKGLSDVTAKINTITNIGQDGETETSVYLDSRDITIKGVLRTTNYVEQNTLIKTLNRILDPHYSGTLTYIHESVRRKIGCRASAAPSWSKTSKRPSFTITFFCPNPYWAEDSAGGKKVSGGETSFHFPLPHFSSLDEEWKWPLPIGRTLTNAVFSIRNDSDTDCGMVWTVNANAPVVNPSITNVDTGEFFKLNLSLSVGDVLIVTTAYGKKRARLMHDGEDINVYRNLVFGSSFFPIYRGTNHLRINAESGGNSMESYVNFENQYLGVGL